MIKYDLNEEKGRIRFLSDRFICHRCEGERVHRQNSDYKKRLETGLIISLSLMILCFQMWKQTQEKKITYKDMKFAINVDNVPQTIQERRAPAPSRPSVPIASEEEDIPEDETIEFTNLNFEEIPLPPPPLTEEIDESIPMFVPHDEEPFPIGGYAAIQRNVDYPEIGRKAGMEGTVLLHVRIEENGTIKYIKVLRSLDIDSFTKSAIKAVKAVQWEPAKQRDKAIAVWVSVPIKFELISGS